MIGQFSLNFEEIVVDIRSGTKFMTGVASEFVKPTTSLKIEFIRRKTKIAVFFFLNASFTYLYQIDLLFYEPFYMKEFLNGYAVVKLLV